MLVYLTIVCSLPGIARFEVPLARLASQVWRFGQPLFVTVFAAEVYTTAVANLMVFRQAHSSGNQGLRTCRVCHHSRGATGRIRVFPAGESGISLVWLGRLGFHSRLRVYLARMLVQIIRHSREWCPTPGNSIGSSSIISAAQALPFQCRTSEAGTIPPVAWLVLGYRLWLV